MSADRSTAAAAASFNARPLFDTLENRTLLSASVGPLADGLSAAPAAATVQPAVTKSSSRTYIKSLTGASTSFGAHAQFVATVTRKNGTPVTAGTVTFKLGSTTLGTFAVNLKGKAVLDTTTLAVGNGSITATFNGTKSFYASTSAALAHAVTKASTTTAIVQPDSTTLMGETATLTAVVARVGPGAGVPTGNVEFRDNGTLVATVGLNSNGRAVFTSGTLFLGGHSFTAKYVGSAGYNTSTSASATQTISEGTYTTLANNLNISTRVAGTGTGAANGTRIYVNYTGYLTNGTKFDSSLNPGRTPFDFVLGNDNVIDGWHKGLVGIKVGETRLLKIPPALAYGVNGSPPNIPGNATLFFVVTRLGPRLGVSGGTGLAVPVAYNNAPSAAIGTTFASAKVGSAGGTATFALSSIESNELQFTGNTPVFSAGANAADFVVSAPAVVNGQVTFTVKFTPKAKGTRTANIAITTNDYLHPTFVFTVTGTGT